MLLFALCRPQSLVCCVYVRDYAHDYCDTASHYAYAATTPLSLAGSAAKAIPKKHPSQVMHQAPEPSIIRYPVSTRNRRVFRTTVQRIRR